VLCCAVLCCAVLCCAVLCCAVLCCAVLCCAVLCCAVLCCAVLVARCCVRCAVTHVLAAVLQSLLLQDLRFKCARTASLAVTCTRRTSSFCRPECSAFPARNAAEVRLSRVCSRHRAVVSARAVSLCAWQARLCPAVSAEWRRFWRPRRPLLTPLKIFLRKWGGGATPCPRRRFWTRACRLCQCLSPSTSRRRFGCRARIRAPCRCVHVCCLMSPRTTLARTHVEIVAGYCSW
jgi:hypothetical protein